MTDPTKPTPETRAAEREEADATHEPDREPSAEEERAAEGNKVDPEAARHEEEMNRRGAEQKGEGRI